MKLSLSIWVLVLLGAGLLLGGCAGHLSIFAPVPTQTITTSPTATATLTLPPTVTLTPTTEPTATPTLTPTPPLEILLTNFKAHHQARSLDCEAAAAVDLAAYYGVKINEYDFQFSLPISDNPDLGFVGNSNDDWGQVPPYSYGVYAGPVADLLNKKGLPARSIKGMTLDEAKAELAAGNPIIAWVIANNESGVPIEYTDRHGNRFVAAPFEHVIILYGYNATDIFYWNAGRRFHTPFDLFLRSWKVLGNMSVVKK